jgi:subtilisin family serine protease
MQLLPFKMRQVSSQTMNWGLICEGIPSLWKITKGCSIKVAIIDTGIALRHHDLADAILNTTDFTKSKIGADDILGHGTFCAGIIGARQNGPCIVGVAPECQLLVAKVVSDNGACYDQAVIDALYWAAEQDADVISMSVGSPTPTEELHNAVISVSQRSIIVCAAGNNGPALDSVNYPARYTETIGVGAIDRRKRVPSYSSRGDRVDIVAPGDEVVSCWPPNRIAMLSGTSAACPFVAGVIALIVADRKQDNRATLHRDEMLDLLNESAIDIEKPGRDKLSGFGLINPSALLRESDERYPK